MDDQNKRHRVNWIFTRWSHLNLMLEQAQKIAYFDREQRAGVLSSNLSYWERWDYEFYIFGSILNPDQLALYVYERDKKINEYEQSLIDDDNLNSTLKEIERDEEEIKYLEYNFLPAILMKFNNHLSVRDPQNTKYDFLKAEYKSYLDEKHRTIIANHFRHRRGFQPNTLKRRLLKHTNEAMFPQFSEFKKEMDDITKSVVDFLKGQGEHFDHNKEEISSILADLRAFREKAWDNYVKSENPVFYAFSVLDDKRSEEEQNNDLYFSLLLIDKDYYNYKQ
ncbi:hypothetical protein [Mucilaginibacter gotjawali]|uniref:Uncharacterized protein n=2 Tax=Mucilaginibacter gotjawali TaxID=1550579 RepID=A0A110B248_9SPHI|nr:hypothetical protein [Mucilaginibacter gotjawali]MBB3056219.1 hypothetical protein [Mucilaginibacter gotjawali]BAU53438.1 hypothetical protein MgSA37_01606 [Mucilaginibacter gotjawali]